MQFLNIFRTEKNEINFFGDIFIYLIIYTLIYLFVYLFIYSFMSIEIYLKYFYETQQSIILI